jgi:broad specificity phosphatase PhoE
MILLHRFWLIRHALVHADALRYLYGTNDVPICDNTMAANAHAYATLAKRLPRPARWVCTPLSRTRLTAEAIMRAGYPAQELQVEDAFVEQNFGDWQGMKITDFETREADMRHPFWPVHAEERPPAGENFSEMTQRVGAGLDRLAASATGKDTVIISHGGAIRAACAHALGLTGYQALCLAVENISLTRLERHDNGWRMVSLNEQLSTLACVASGTLPNTSVTNTLEQTEGTRT